MEIHVKKRLFIAIKINFSNDIINTLNDTKKILNDEKIKWVNFDQFHLTLKFLGDTDTNLIPKIISRLNNITSLFKPFNLNFKGFGIFKNFNNPRVLWVGIDKNEHLTSLHKLIDTSLNSLGFEKEKRDFNPHLTLGRIKFLKNRKKLMDYILKNSKKELEIFQVNEFFLIESILKREGPTYIDIKDFPLKIKD